MGQRQRAEGERGKEENDRSDTGTPGGKPTARSDRAGRGAQARTERGTRERDERTEKARGRGSGRCLCPILPPQGGYFNFP